MKVKVLGTRGEIKPSLPYHSRHTGLLVDGEILLDLGEPEFLEKDLGVILITHLHPDHAFFVKSDKKVDVNVPIYAPESSENVEVTVVSEPFTVFEYNITPILTHHSKKVRSVAYLIEKNGKRLLYTGDMIWINKEYWNLFENLDLVITEGSFICEGGMIRRDKETGKIFGHTGIPDLMKFFENFTNRVLLIHFGSWFYKNTKESRKRVENLARKYDLEVLVGYDGMEFEL
ncbi:MAG: MBL fold metallo-hydrolase [Patescibacteria group bacterium]|nr:MBL fold metallo-hydrolase [Patescibacteria group bacterium]